MKIKEKNIIYMSEILSKAPKRLNPKKGNHLYQITKDKSEILNLKIKILNQKEIIISLKKMRI